ncbi:MAG: uracil-DNA glycosylase [Chitinispirillia bacterium]|jgi:DNA polymerase
MDKNLINQIESYFTQQKELCMPDFILSNQLRAGKKKNRLNKRDLNSTYKSDNSHINNIYQKKREALVELYYSCRNCTKCSLSFIRTNMVFGSGNANAELMIIGEAPGFEEDKQGKPFVGKAGELLTKMVGAINIDREKDAFITNILKCRPPENRNPNQQEEVACMPVLKMQIEIIQPKVILVLGKIAANALLNISESIGKIRVECHNYNNIPVVVTYHPAALLRNKRYKRPAWEDLQKLKKKLNRKDRKNG